MSPKDDAELKRLSAMLAARTKEDGSPKLGWKSSVSLIKHLIADIESRNAAQEPANG